MTSILGVNLPAAADELVFKSGERRQGRVESVRGNLDRLALISSAGRIEIPRSLVSEIVEEDDAADYTLIGEQFLKNASYETAIQNFQKALEADSAFTRAHEGLEKAKALIGEKQQEARRQAEAENTGLLGTIQDAIKEERYEDAERLLGRVLETSPTDEQKAAVQLLRRDLYLAWGASRIDKLDPFGAEQLFQKVLEIDPGNKDVRNHLLEIWEKDSSKREEVLAAYQERLAADPADLVVNQKVADLQLALGRPGAALEALTRLHDSGRYRALGYDEKLQDALDSTAQGKAAQGDLDGAIETYKHLFEIFPNTDNSPLAYLNYEKNLQALEPDDWAGKGALLASLERDGLHDFAVKEAELIVSNDPKNEAALAFLRTDAQGRLKEIQDTFSQGDYYLARNMARTFAETVTRFPDLLASASDLYTKADIEAERHAKQVREQAKDIALRGDEYYFDARRYAELMKSRESSDRSTVISYKQEAIKYARRAIDTYQIALKIDPTLGPVTGMDVSNKLTDAQELYGSLTASPVNRPSHQMRPRVAQPTGG
ncbi:hypothetical protein HZA57_02025 [Candidatus Poribacteria bacterium]|nr:hypothetical protein [Candidatus Poribacteria bacterium]